MHDMIKEIIKMKKKELGIDNKNRRDNLFFTVMNNASNVALIAELKFASPSVGILGSSSELLKRAKIYEQGGADAISIITEKHFFHGDPAFILKVKKRVSVPILQKDFIIDERQICQAGELGTDALLLIARIVSEEKLKDFVKLCFAIGIEPVVEIHTEDDLKKTMVTDARIIAVNARDLDTFSVAVLKACALLRKIPNKYITLGFSGIISTKEVQMYKNAGAKGVLVGTNVMKAEDPREFLRSLRI